jgi:hypothetical protein
VDRLLVGVCGAAAILGLPSYLATLRAGLASEVRVIMTPAATRILLPSTVAMVSDGVFVDETPTQIKIREYTTLQPRRISHRGRA